jgi:hypothetical protein
MRAVGGRNEGIASGVDRLRDPPLVASSSERDLVHGVHDLTGLGRRRFVPMPVEIGRGRD